MKTVHELFTNKRMGGTIFVNSWLYSRTVVSARVEGLPLAVLGDVRGGAAGGGVV